MIFCVVPEQLAPELFDKLVGYYEGDPNVEVIIDRRATQRRGGGPAEDKAHRREIRDRRRSRIPGEFPPLDVHDVGR
jgi:hypothetical protein